MHNVSDERLGMHLCHGDSLVSHSELVGRPISDKATIRKGKGDLILAAVLRVERFLKQKDTSIVRLTCPATLP